MTHLRLPTPSHRWTGARTGRRGCPRDHVEVSRSTSGCSDTGGDPKERTQVDEVKREIEVSRERVRTTPS